MSGDGQNAKYSALGRFFTLDTRERTKFDIRYDRFAPAAVNKRPLPRDPKRTNMAKLVLSLAQDFGEETNTCS